MIADQESTRDRLGKRRRQPACGSCFLESDFPPSGPEAQADQYWIKKRDESKIEENDLTSMAGFTLI
jgi:hypothetical protein